MKKSEIITLRSESAAYAWDLFGSGELPMVQIELALLAMRTIINDEVLLRETIANL